MFFMVCHGLLVAMFFMFLCFYVVYRLLEAFRTKKYQVSDKQ